jgi:hypothetical protein
MRLSACAARLRRWCLLVSVVTAGGGVVSRVDVDISLLWLVIAAADYNLLLQHINEHGISR